MGHILYPFYKYSIFIYKHICIANKHFSTKLGLIVKKILFPKANLFTIDNCHYEKIGKDIVCIEEELKDFDFPASWAICRLITIADIYNGNSINESDKKKYYTGLTDGYNYIGTKDIGFDHIVDYENGVKIPFNNDKFRIAYKDSPLLCIEGGSAGRKIVILEEDVCFGNKLCAFRSFGIVPKFLYYYLQSPLFVSVFKSKTTGLIGGVSINTIKELFFAIPPLEEQKRIVAYVEEVFKVIDLVEKNQNNYANLVEVLKSAILKSAIQGTLVEQSEDDEPASVLLEKIREEKKAQLGKKYIESYIYKGDDNRYYEHIGEKNIDITEKIPFDLPLGWCWEKISNVTLFQEGPGILAVDFRDKGIPLIRIAGMKGSFVSLEGCNYLDEEMVSKKWNHFRLDKGDIVISTSASMDKIAEVNEDTVGAIPYTGLIRFKMTSCLLSSYFKYFIRSPFYMRQIDEQKSGALISHYGPSHLNKMIIPVPSLAEQERIVSKINEIFAQL